MPARALLKSLFFAALLVPGAARGGGFEIDGQSPAGTAMAGALTAFPVDAAAIFYNPAGLVLQRGGSVLAGTSLATASTRLVSAGGLRVDAERTLLPLPIVYAAAPLGARVAVGIGVFSQFAGATAWPALATAADGTTAPFPGRFLATRAAIHTVTINPTVAFLATERIAFGAGLDVVLASADLRRDLSLGDGEGTFSAAGSARAVGANLGVLADILPGRLSFGFAYRTGTTLAFDLKAHFDAPAELRAVLVDQPASLALPLPHQIAVGVALRPIDRLTIAVDARAVDPHREAADRRAGRHREHVRRLEALAGVVAEHLLDARLRGALDLARGSNTFIAAPARMH